MNEIIRRYYCTVSAIFIEELEIVHNRYILHIGNILGNIIADYYRQQSHAMSSDPLGLTS